MSQAREHLIANVKERLIMPRLLIMLVLSITALAAVLTSFFLLSAGVFKMWMRYPIAIVIAYLTFLSLLAVWLWFHGHSNASDFVVPDYGGGTDRTNERSSSRSVLSKVEPPEPIDLSGLDFEEGCLIALAILAILAGIVATLYVIWIAPALLAEIFVDGALVAGLYSRVKQIERRHWLRAALRQTAVPALFALFFFTAAGYLLQRAIPQAHSIGEVWHHLVG